MYQRAALFIYRVLDSLSKLDGSRSLGQDISIFPGARDRFVRIYQARYAKKQAGGQPSLLM
jgi:hypothetical protein